MLHRWGFFHYWSSLPSLQAMPWLAPITKIHMKNIDPNVHIENILHNQDTPDHPVIPDKDIIKIDHIKKEVEEHTALSAHIKQTSFQRECMLEHHLVTQHL